MALNGNRLIDETVNQSKLNLDLPTLDTQAATKLYTDSRSKLNNYNAIIDPNVNDDITLGYEKGSYWFNGSNIFYCVSNTSGAAVWQRLNYEVIRPIDGTTNDISNIEAYAIRQLIAGLPMFFFDPLNQGFVINGMLGSGQSYNKLQWIAVGTNSDIGIKLKITNNTATTIGNNHGISGFGINCTSSATAFNLTINGYSEHIMQMWNEFRALTGSGGTLTLGALDAKFQRFELQTGTNIAVQILGRSKIDVQDITRCTVNIQSAAFLKASRIGTNTVINVGYNGTTAQDDAHLEWYDKTGSGQSINVYGNRCILRGSDMPINIQANCTDTVILGTNNTLTDNGLRTNYIPDLYQINLMMKNSNLANTNGAAIGDYVAGLIEMQTLNYTIQGNPSNDRVAFFDFDVIRNVPSGTILEFDMTYLCNNIGNGVFEFILAYQPNNTASNIVTNIFGATNKTLTISTANTITNTIQTFTTTDNIPKNSKVFLRIKNLGNQGTIANNSVFRFKKIQIRY